MLILGIVLLLIYFLAKPLAILLILGIVFAVLGLFGNFSTGPWNGPTGRRRYY